MVVIVLVDMMLVNVNLRSLDQSFRFHPFRKIIVQMNEFNPPGYIPMEDEAALLFNINKLLSAVGIASKSIKSIHELCMVASSLFVAIYEALFQERIYGIIRTPKVYNDYERNAQLVIDSLGDQIQVDLKHINGRSIVTGDLRVLSNLVSILLRIVSLTGWVLSEHHYLMRYQLTQRVNLFYFIVRSPSPVTIPVYAQTVVSDAVCSLLHYVSLHVWLTCNVEMNDR